MSFINSHATMDAEHMADLRKILNTLDDEPAREAIVESTLVNFHHFTRIIEAGMNVPACSRRPAAAACCRRPYKYLRLEWTQRAAACCACAPASSRSSATAWPRMTELQRVLDDIAANPGLVRHLVMTLRRDRRLQLRRRPLAVRAAGARAATSTRCKMYGRRCVDLVWWLENAAQRGVHTTVLVQGDTLGGGLESVLPFHKVIFERSAQAGFPGGAVQPVPRHGRLELHDPQGRLRGRQRHDAVRAALHRRAAAAAQPGRPGGRRRRGRGGHRRTWCAPSTRACAARWRRCRRSAWPRRSPTSRCSTIVDLWAETALTLTDRDLRLMERLARAQVRKAGGADEGAVEEIKRIELDTAWGELRSGNTGFGDERDRPHRLGPCRTASRLPDGRARRAGALEPPAAHNQCESIVAQLVARVGLGQVGVHAHLAARARRPRRRRWRSARRSACAAGRCARSRSRMCCVAV